MSDVIDLANSLKKSADDFLKTHQVEENLGKLSKVQIVGSYMYNLMTWKNLDILIVSKELSRDKFYKLGDYFVKEFNPKYLRFEDKSINIITSTPTGYYWEVETEDGWLLSIWNIDETEAKVQEQIRNEIYNGLNEKKRELILTLKLSPDYRKYYSAAEVYMAVLQDGVTSVNEFKIWLKRRR